LTAIVPAAVLWAQGTVTIFGTITDSTGAVVPGARVVVRNVQTGLERETRTNEAGGYVVSQLPVGVYTVTAEAAGFKSGVQENIRVQVDENRRVDFRLEVGAVTESITVEAAIAQVETREGTLKEVVDAERIVELPLNGRNAIELQYLVAGVGGRTDRDQQQNPSVSINGSRTNANNYVLDGGDNHDPYFNSPAAFPNPDALQEFSIQTNAYSADRGRNAGIIMSAVTKSGTNQLHGSLFEFLRNEKLNARNFFAVSVPPFKRNQYGGTLGGPIRKNKLFYFTSYQGTRERSAPGSLTATVLSQAQRQGDFSEILPRTLRDPQGGLFPGNIIPRSRLHPASLKFLEEFIPLPNRPGNLYSFASQQKVDDEQVIVKVDYNPSEAHRFYGRLLYNYDYTDQAVGNVPGFLAGIDYRNWNWVANHTYTISPSVLNVASFSFADIDRVQIPVVPKNLTWMDLGANFTRAAEGTYPAGHDTNVQGYFNAFSRFPLNHFRQNYAVTDTLSMSRGVHYLRVGGELRRSLLNLQELFRCDPYVLFRNQFTGDAAGDFLLGRPSQIQQIAETSNKPRAWEVALFVQDDWKPARRLSLNLGVRWEPFLPFVDVTDKFAQVRLGYQSKRFPTAPPGVVFAGDPGVPRALIRSRWLDLGPRFGFAWDLFGTGRTALRGGYGIFYAKIRQQAHNQISTAQPFSIKLTIDAPPLGLNNPYSETGNPFPFRAPGNAQEAEKYRWVLPMELQQWNVDFRNAIVQQWNLNLQQQLGASYVVTLAYVGSKGNHLYMQNQANPGIYGRPGNLNQRRPLYPIFGSIIDMSSQGNSTYHAFQATLNKRLSRGFTVLANYTFGKLLDDASSDGDGPANPWNIAAEKGHSDFDITQRFVASYIWLLPILRRGHPVLRSVLGDWELNGIIVLETGRWLTVVSGQDRSGTGVNEDRADVVGDWRLPSNRSRNERIARWFNTDAFAVNAAGTFGTAGRNIIPGPGQVDVTFGLFKNFAVREGHRLQFRAELFNALNRVNLGNPNMNRSSGNFGRITSAGAPRVVQLALKYSF
jgi:hypothetical protein